MKKALRKKTSSMTPIEFTDAQLRLILRLLLERAACLVVKAQFCGGSEMLQREVAAAAANTKALIQKIRAAKKGGQS